jgi:hypothetical protein
MTDFKQDARRIQQMIGAAKNSADALSLLAENYAAEPSKLQTALENVLIHFETSVLTLRTLFETYNAGAGLPSKRPVLPGLAVAGSVDLIENHWLHIRLETLLPSCRYQTPAYRSDTIIRLLDSFEARGQKLPFFRKAFLVIDEHSHIDGRRVFDQDNKAWKAIPNALKGRVIPDDDQYTLGVALILILSTGERLPHHSDGLSGRIGFLRPALGALLDGQHVQGLLRRGYPSGLE